MRLLFLFGDMDCLLKICYWGGQERKGKREKREAMRLLFLSGDMDCLLKIRYWGVVKEWERLGFAL